MSLCSPHVALSVLWQIVKFYAITCIGPDRGSDVGPGKSSRILALFFVKIQFCYPAARRYSAVKLGDKGVESAAFITRKKKERTILSEDVERVDVRNMIKY